MLPSASVGLLHRAQGLSGRNPLSENLNLSHGPMAVEVMFRPMVTEDAVRTRHGGSLHAPLPAIFQDGSKRELVVAGSALRSNGN